MQATSSPIDRGDLLRDPQRPERIFYGGSWWTTTRHDVQAPPAIAQRSVAAGNYHQISLDFDAAWASEYHGVNLVSRYTALRGALEHDYHPCSPAPLVTIGWVRFHPLVLDGELQAVVVDEVQSDLSVVRRPDCWDTFDRAVAVLVGRGMARRDAWTALDVLRPWTSLFYTAALDFALGHVVSEYPGTPLWFLGSHSKLVVCPNAPRTIYRNTPQKHGWDRTTAPCPQAFVPALASGPVEIYVPPVFLGQ